MNDDFVAAAFAGFKYNPVTGSVIGKTRKKVGTLSADGYLVVSVRKDRKVIRMYAHRLAFILMGEPLPPVVDHVDGIRTNNRWANLRASSKALNAQNLKGPRADNTSGFLGVYKEKRTGKFVAAIRVQGKNTHLGSFHDPLVAHAAYLSAKQKLHAHNTL